MMHITEDTPPDMLAGAMDLTVHLPNGRAVKMSVERCTPMMDVLMQITTAHQLQLSGYVIEALGMAPSSEYSDKILPYKPNTPIGTLDTQHIRVVQKPRTLPIPKNIPPGHQPFESTFRLKVHLPRKQLFVSRVSMNVLLEDIMRKVCDEKNLDPNKYEFRHPDNQNEVLDPKLTLEDYKITEIFVVSKGSSRLSQAFSASDIMALRKDDERKHSKSSSGGVFNLIFKRGKMSNGSGSVSSDNRSISPTHSDDSRSVTPPAIQQQLIKTSTVVAATTAPEKPKAPLRKRRPAPKPPQPKPETTSNPIKPDDVPKRHENGLTICHSRNSSDSSGYHEASILSDNANTSLPRRPQTLMNEVRVGEKLNGEHSKSTGNLATMSLQSKSTSSLAFTGRKKKAPPPPPAFKSSGSVDNLEKASPVVASPVEHRDLPTEQPKKQYAPVPAPRKLKTDEQTTTTAIKPNSRLGHNKSASLDRNDVRSQTRPQLSVEEKYVVSPGVHEDKEQVVASNNAMKVENNGDENVENSVDEIRPKTATNYFMLLQKNITQELRKIHQQKTQLKPVLRNWRSEENVYNFNSGEITTNKHGKLFDKLKKQQSFHETTNTEIMEDREKSTLPNEEVNVKLSGNDIDKGIDIKEAQKTEELAYNETKNEEVVVNRPHLKKYSNENTENNAGELECNLEMRGNEIMNDSQSKSEEKSETITKTVQELETHEKVKSKEQSEIITESIEKEMKRGQGSESVENVSKSVNVLFERVTKPAEEMPNVSKAFERLSATKSAQENVTKSPNSKRSPVDFPAKSDDFQEEDFPVHKSTFNNQQINLEDEEDETNDEINTILSKKDRSLHDGNNPTILPKEKRILNDENDQILSKEKRILMNDESYTKINPILSKEKRILHDENNLPKETKNLHDENNTILSEEDRILMSKEDIPPRYSTATHPNKLVRENSLIDTKELLNTKDESMKHRRDIKYKRMSSFISDSEDFEENWLPDGKQEQVIEESEIESILKIKEKVFYNEKIQDDYNQPKVLNYERDVLRIQEEIVKQKLLDDERNKEDLDAGKMLGDGQIIGKNLEDLVEGKVRNIEEVFKDLFKRKETGKVDRIKGKSLDSKENAEALKKDAPLKQNQTKKVDELKNNYMQAIENIDVDLFNPKYQKTATPLFPKTKSTTTNHQNTNDTESSTFGIAKASPETSDERPKQNAYDTFTRKRGFGIGKALLDLNQPPTNTTNSSYGDDEMSDVNVEMFAVSETPVKVSSSSRMDELLGIHSFEPDVLKKRHSLNNRGKIPGFGGISKWSNCEALDDDGAGSKWVIGRTDAEPVEPKLPEEQLMPVGRQQFATSSPPESIASSLATTLSSNIETDINLSKENSEIIENDEKDNTFLPIQNNDKTKAEAEWKYPMQNNEKTTKEEEWKFSVQNSEKIKEEKWMQNSEKVKAEGEWEYPVVPKVAEAETEWEYRLPSPPTAFRDDSPDHSHFQSNGEFGAADSVVTSPELFEKLAKHAAREAAPSEVSEEEKPVFNNKLSLENLEKRKSLVYNRELATSLKCRDEDNARTESVSSKRSSVLSELEELITNTTAKPLSAKPVANFLQTDSNLPNFKITTYDMPKRKINIFEDDSIRSNENTVAKADAKYKAKTLARVESNAEASLPVARSGSFSAGDWSPANPVKRSKSQVAINQYKGETMHETTATNTTANGDGGLSKANSLFDVSGLQSLEVMRKIRTKLKTPSTSTDELDRTEAPPKYGPPSINLGTWSERPKSQITLKEDGDYKYKQQVVNLRVNGVQQSTAKLTQGLENGFHLRNGDEKTGECEVDGFTRVSRLGNSETINQQPAGNVIIKIGGEAKKDDFRTRFITPVGFRRPQEKPQRPHSVAFDSSFDISRVPRVHSVELKKPYKDMNRSITQITNEPETKSLNYTINNNNNKNGLSRINSFSLNNDEYTTNKNVPFAQVKLRRTDSNRNAQIVNNNNNNNSVFGNVVLRNTANRFSCGDVAPPPPPPPAMAKLAPPKSRNVPNNQPQVDPRDELLSAIRNFGGKKGLKSMKV